MSRDTFLVLLCMLCAVMAAANHNWSAVAGWIVGMFAHFRLTVEAW